MLRRTSSLVAGRRAKWVVFAVWLLLSVALGPLQVTALLSVRAGTDIGA